MKKALLFSILLNLALITLLIGFVLKYTGKSIFQSDKWQAKSEQERPNWYYKNYHLWKESKSMFEILPDDSGEIIFLGNSLTSGCAWAELFANPKIKNRGIGGDNTEGVLERLTEINRAHPDKIFIDLGTNDLGLKIPIPKICANYQEIISRIKKESPRTTVYIQSVLPVHEIADRSNDSIRVLNGELQKIATSNAVQYINLYDHFADDQGELNMKYSFEGLHLNGQGYLLWKSLIEKQVNE